MKKIRLIIKTIFIIIMIIIISIAGLYFFYQPKLISPEPPQKEPFLPKPEPEISSIIIPAYISNDYMEYMANQYVQDVIYSEDNIEIDKNTILKLSVFKMQDITVTSKNNQINATIPVQFRAEFRKKRDLFGNKPQNSTVSKGEISIHLQSTIQLMQDWRYITTTKINYEWNKKPYIKWGFFKFNAEKIADKIIQEQLSALEKNLDQSLNTNLNIKKQAEEAWLSSYEPILIHQEPNIWLDVDAQSIHATPLKASNDGLNFTIALSAYLKTIIDKKPSKRKPKPMPNLNMSLPKAKGFSISLPIVFGYQELSAITQENLKNTVIPLQKNTKLTIHNVEIYGNGNNVIIATNILIDFPISIFDINTRLFIVSKPTLDKEKQLLKLSSLRLDTNSNNLLSEVANSLINHKTLIEEIEKHMTFSMKETIVEQKTAIEKQLNSTINDSMQSSGKVENLEFSSLYIGPENITANIKAKGNLKILFTKTQ